MKEKLLKNVSKILKIKQQAKPKASPKQAKQENFNPKFTKQGLRTSVFNILTKNQFADIVAEAQQANTPQDFIALPEAPIDIEFEVLESKPNSSNQNENLTNSNCEVWEKKYNDLLEKYEAVKRNEPEPMPEVFEFANNLVQWIDLNKISTNTKLFQNRDNEFSERSVFNIINAVNAKTFNWQELDPILLFRDKDDIFGQLYILSGHSRTEAFRRLSSQKIVYRGRAFNQIPAKIITTTLEEARKIAKRSNTLNTSETDIERAKFYRELRQEENGISFNRLEKISKEREGDEWLYRVNLSYLNPAGNALSALRLLQNATEQENRTVRTLADWTGESRRLFPQLRNSHENEIFDWLLTEAYGTKQGQFTNKKKFLARLEQSIDKISFDANKPLNLKRALQRSPIEEEYYKQLEEAKRELKEAKDELESKRKELAMNYPKPTAEQAELIKNILGNLNLKIQSAQRKFINVDSQYEKVMQAVKQQTALFGLGEIPQLNASTVKINKLRLDVKKEANQLETALLKLDEYLNKLPDSFRLTREYKETKNLIDRYVKSAETGLKGFSNFAPKYQNLGSMGIATISSNFFGAYSNQKELYNKVKEWIKSNLAGKKVYVTSCDLTIELNWQGLKNDINEYHPPYIEKLISFGVLEEIIKNAEYFKGEQDKKGRQEVKAVHKLISKVSIDNVTYDVVIVCIETTANFIYDHFLLI